MAFNDTVSGQRTRSYVTAVTEPEGGASGRRQAENESVTADPKRQRVILADNGSDSGSDAEDDHEGEAWPAPPPPGPWNQRVLGRPIQMARFLLFTYVTPLFLSALDGQLRPSDMYGILKRHSSAQQGAELEAQYKKNKAAGYKHPLRWALLSTHSSPLMIAGVYLGIEFSCAVLQAWLLGELLNGIADESSSDSSLYGLAAALSGVSFVRQMCLHTGAMFQWSNGMELRSSAIAVLFRKVTRLRSETLSRVKTGHLISVMTADAERFVHTWSGHSVWLAPLLTGAVIGVGWTQIGPSILAGTGVMILLLPLQLLFGRLFARLRRKTSRCTDNRVSTMKDIIDGIRSVRAAAWETPFSEVIEDLRKHEMKYLVRGASIKAFNMSTFFGSISFSSIAALLTYSATGEVLTPAKAFTVFSLFAAVRLPIGMMLPTWIQIYNELSNTIDRMEAILDLEETPTYGAATQLVPSPVIGQNAVVSPAVSGSVVSSAEKSTFYALEVRELRCGWHDVTNEDGSQPYVLDGVNLAVKWGELAVVRGAVGSGKTTFLMAILGEIQALAGTVRLAPSTAAFYAPQQPWVFPGSVRENVLFGAEMDSEKYRATVEACQLAQDLLLFEGGDGTMIGERGITLSGGQKARISLARAVYAAHTSKNPALVLLDDPFSAVDAKVGTKIYTQVIRGLLRRHAVVLVTHHSRFGQDADVHLSLSDDAEVPVAKASDDAERVTEGEVQEDTPQVGEVQDVTSPPPTGWQTRRRSKAVIQSEHRHEGNVTSATVMAYVSAFGSKPAILFLVLLLVGTQILQVQMEFFLATWAQDSEEADNLASTTNSTRDIPNRQAALGYYFVGFVLALFARTFVFMRMAMEASRLLHDRAFVGLINTALRFFDTQPTGRILNRFSKDVDYVDDLMPITALDVVQLGMLCAAVSIVVCIVDPFVLVIVCPCIGAFFLLRKFYVKTSREVKRIEGTSRSPLYAHLSMTVDGLAIVRTYPGAAERILDRFSELHDNHTRSWFTFILTSRWLGFRLDLIVSSLVFVASFSAVAQRDTIGAGNAGLSLAYIMTLTGVFQWAVRQSAEMENQLTAVERLNEYALLPAESETVSCGGPGQCDGCKGVLRDAGLPPWEPKHGEIEFEDVRLWYADPTAAVLHGVSLKIAAGSKVGVVGRTGAGKSSLIAALLRLAPTSGTIRVDGVPSCSVPLSDLRRAFTLIPQDPALFAGSIRKNLDPFHECNDSELWRALESAQLRDVVMTAGGLDAIVAEAGSNYSVGERQLICLARAVLRPTKILLLDEATANVDMKTDSIIQAVIRKRFAKCTVITIAHRLNTVLDSDYMLVMDAGKAIEYGPPAELLRDTTSKLAGFGLKSLPTVNDAITKFKGLRELAPEVAHESQPP